LVKSKKRFNNLPSKSLLGIEVLTNTPKLNRLRNTIKERLKLQKKLQKTYAALLKSQNSLLTMESRQGRLLSVLNKLEAHPIISTFHNYTEESQNIVDMILLDQRCRPGQKILKLWEAIKATEINEIPPHEIVDFLQDFVDQTATEFGVPDELLNQLRLCVGRSVYPILFPLLWKFQFAENEQLDVEYEKQKQILVKLPPEKLDTVLASFAPELFQVGVSILEELAFQIVPADMLMVLYRTMEQIHAIAKSNIGGDLGADDLFPIWLYITIHSNVSLIHSHLCYMDHFATPEESMTQLGYCLTTFQACVAHIRTVDTSQFDE